MKLIETELFKPANFLIIATISIITAIGYTAFKHKAIKEVKEVE